MRVLSLVWASALCGMVVAGCAGPPTRQPAPVEDASIGDAPNTSSTSEDGATRPPSAPPDRHDSKPARSQPPGPQKPSKRVAQRPPVPPTSEGVIGLDQDLAVVIAKPGDTAASLATRFLGSPAEAWQIEELNSPGDFTFGQDIVIPLRPVNPSGVRFDGYQTVPILCYHRFSATASVFSLTRGGFEAQLNYLARNGYSVIPLSRLLDFLAGKSPLPPKSIVITIDDGYRSIYEVAYPLLRKYGFPATLFLYTDFVGARDALTWPQMRDMLSSGLIDIQSHSKTHGNLAVRLRTESERQYRDRVRQEIRVPPQTLRRHLGIQTDAFAYPYGDTDATVALELSRNAIPMGLTVSPGGNGFFAHPLMLRRTMIFGTDSLKQFEDKLQVYVPTKGN